ncbi:MAG TPA: AAA family ATPase [Candidatus Solibacter sp.]|nr:AAA family ATPase [Candidatus Solibacter sp.]
MGVTKLIGRDAELGQLDVALGEATEHGGALFVTGAPGIGKTSLLDAAAINAKTRDYRVLTVTGLQSEADLPYAGLHQLLQPVLSSAGAIPGPQKNALLTAMGMRAGSPPEVFLVALATLSLLDEVSDEAPLVVLADDYQWLDDATSTVLRFVARRLDSTHILVIAGLRDSFQAAFRSWQLPEIRLEPLSDTASAELLGSVAPDLDVQTRRLILDEALGNPLALIELPRALRLRGTDGREGALRSVPLTDRLEQTFSVQARQLPEITQSALLLIALDKDANVGDVVGATRNQVGEEVTVDVLQPALDAGLISVEGSTVRYRHPLMRSALDQAASARQRRNAHIAFAEVIEDPDRRAWHRAKAVIGEDEGAAADLEVSAGRAQDRGAPATALGALELAASVTPHGPDRARRLLAAAELAFQLGDPPAVARLLDGAATLELSPHDNGRMAWLREILYDGAPGEPNAIARLVAAAREAAAEGDRNLALNLLQGAALRCWWADPGAAAKALVIDAVEAVAGDVPDPRALEILALAAPIDAASRITSGVRGAAQVEDSDPSRTQILAFATYAAGNLGEAIELMDRAAPGLRAQGRIGILAQLLDVRAWVGINTGQFRQALVSIEEAHQLAIETSQPIWTAISKLGLAVLSGLHGDEEAAERLIAEAIEPVASLRLSIVAAKAEFARGVTHLTAGRHSEAFDHFMRMYDAHGPAYHERVALAAAPYLIESGVRAGRDEETRQMMTLLEALGERTPADLVHIGLRFARPLLADDSEAQNLYEVALDAEPKWPFDFARLELSYGSWLRRQRRISESRPHLRAAQDMFAALGVLPWADKARRELRAAGESTDEPVRAPLQQLSPQELQIAQMAATGLSNREIAESLFLSHRTVGTHLYRVFPKLGIVSRSELARALASIEPALTQETARL